MTADHCGPACPFLCCPDCPYQTPTEPRCNGRHQVSKRKCVICGKDPAEGFASTWTAKDGERWFCHGDDDDPSCYMAAPLTLEMVRILTLDESAAATEETR